MFRVYTIDSKGHIGHALGRVDVKAILSSPEKRKTLIVGACLALQRREGIETTQEQMEAAYDAVQAEKQPRSLVAVYTACGATTDG